MVKSINFDWRFKDDFKETYLEKTPLDALKIDIPHSIKVLPSNYFNEKDFEKVTTYFKTFDLEDYENKSVILRFEAFMVKAKIYLNSVFLGEFVSGFRPVEIELKDYLKEKNNRLVVVLDSSELEDVPPFGYTIDYLTFGGIYREVSLLVRSINHIDKVLVHAYKDGKVNVTSLVAGERKNIRYEVYFNDELVTSSSEDEFNIDSPLVWDINSPNLYTLKAILNDGEDTYVTRFGCRDFKFTNKGFFLNGRRVKLVGLNRHQSYPYIGFAAPKSLQEDDANLLKKECGVNIVRTSHYMQSEHFLSRCDELGLLVINEIPGWQFISKEKEWRENFYKNVKSMVEEEYNHPSLIGHGVRIDESQDDHELYLNANKIAHEIDRYRPTLGVRNFKNSELLEDIYAYNDFICKDLTKGLDNPKTIKKGDAPYLVTEYLGHMEPTKSFDSEAQRVYHALRHAKVIDDNYKYDELCGAIGWCFFDYYTHKDFGSGDRICYHGVFDMGRNPKLASYIYKSQQDEEDVLEVLSSLTQGDRPQAFYHEIYVATNLDYVDLYKNETFIKRYYPSRDEFKYMPHPPILINDLIGESFIEPKVKSLKDRKRFASLLSYVAINGLLELKTKHYVTMGYLMLKYKLKYPDLVDIFNRYVSCWGKQTIIYTFKGYKNDKLVKEVKRGPSLKQELRVNLSKDYLETKDTYDALRISVALVNEYDMVLPYASSIVDVEVEGPIELLSPKSESLKGGQLSIYIRSTAKKGEAKVKITCHGLSKEIKIISK